MMSTIVARRLLSPEGMLEYPRLTVEGGVILAIESLSPEEFERAPTSHRFPDATLAPSFLDIHVHGAAGHDVMEGTPAAFEAVGRHLAGHGVGAYLPTTVTAPLDETLRALSGTAREIARRAASIKSGATPLGIHLEGPFLSHAKRGVHTAALLQPASIEHFDRFWQAAEGRILLMTVASELPGALELIAYATKLGVRCSLGHSNATLAEARAGYRAGAVSATHTFNAMRGLDQREPGLTGFVLDEEELYAEIIADGFHVDPSVVRLFSKAKRIDRVLLVTDGMSATGMPDGQYKLGEMEVDVVNGRCTSNGAIAGSVLTLDRGIRNYTQFTGAGLPQAMQAASANPARLVARDSQWGSLAANRPANIAVVSAAGEVVESFLRGVPTMHPL